MFDAHLSGDVKRTDPGTEADNTPVNTQDTLTWQSNEGTGHDELVCDLSCALPLKSSSQEGGFCALQRTARYVDRRWDSQVAGKLPVRLEGAKGS